MSDSLILLLGPVIWAAVVVVTLVTRRLGRGTGVGLTALYLMLLAMIHVPGAIVHALPWFWRREVDLVVAGFGQSLLGVICFGLGALLLEPLTARLRPRSQMPTTNDRQLTERKAWAAGHQGRTPQPGALIALPAGSGGGVFAQAPARAGQVELAGIFILLGILSTLIFVPLTLGVPTGRSIAASLGQLLNIGLGLACWRAWQARHYGRLQLWLLAACALPLATITLDGFLGFGTVALLGILLFVASFIRIRLAWLILVPLLLYLGLSFFVTYMRDRETIREVVWGGQSLGQRTDQVADTIASFELFDPQNQAHLNAIDDRLNQNLLVGFAVSYLDSGLIDFAHGDTIVEAISALVPRVLWPEKPYTAGGSARITRFTGVEFGANTSVGIGQVVEFYANFGTPGVCVGFLLLGWLIGFFDRRSAQALVGGDQLGFTFWYLPGLALMQPGNSLAEMLTTVGAALITALLVIHVLVPLLRTPRITGLATR